MKKNSTLAEEMSLYGIVSKKNYEIILYPNVNLYSILKRVA